MPMFSLPRGLVNRLADDFQKSLLDLLPSPVLLLSLDLLPSSLHYFL